MKSSESNILSLLSADISIDLPGVDSDGVVYPTIDHMWLAVAHLKYCKPQKTCETSESVKTSKPSPTIPQIIPLSLPSQSISTESDVSTSRSIWYSNGHSYWLNTEASTEGILGGLGYVHSSDIQDNFQLIQKLKTKFQVGAKRAIDVGAGIGRVVKECLSQEFDTVDLLEPAHNLMEKAREELQDSSKVGEWYQVGMENFEFTHKYDCIWFQWVLGHLTDRDVVDFLIKCSNALTETGCIVIKENTSSDTDESGFFLDKEDYTVMRSAVYFKKLFDKAGLKLIYIEKFKDFPEDLLPVYKYVFRKKSN